MSELEKIIAERHEAIGQARGEEIGQVRGEVIGEARGNARGNAESLVRCVENYAKKHNVNIEDACEELDVGLEEYNKAKELIKSLSE